MLGNRENGARPGYGWHSDSSRQGLRLRISKSERQRDLIADTLILTWFYTHSKIKKNQVRVSSGSIYSQVSVYSKRYEDQRLLVFLRMHLSPTTYRRLLIRKSLFSLQLHLEQSKDC